jgi:FKBP-type peptidyl-prolyl cis-trans isomerase
MQLQIILVQALFLQLLESSNGFSSSSSSSSLSPTSSSSLTRSKQGMGQRTASLLNAAAEAEEEKDMQESRARTTTKNGPSIPLRRRLAVQTLVWGVAVTGMSFVSLPQQALSASSTAVEEPRSMYEPKFVQQYDDFALTPEGWSFRDVKVGQGESPQLGDRVVFDWSGYTIGYFGRPFQAKG